MQRTVEYIKINLWRRANIRDNTLGTTSPPPCPSGNEGSSNPQPKAPQIHSHPLPSRIYPTPGALGEGGRQFPPSTALRNAFPASTEDSGWFLFPRAPQFQFVGWEMPSLPPAQQPRPYPITQDSVNCTMKKVSAQPWYSTACREQQLQSLGKHRIPSRTGNSPPELPAGKTNPAPRLE